MFDLLKMFLSSSNVFVVLKYEIRLLTISSFRLLLPVCADQPCPFFRARCDSISKDNFLVCDLSDFHSAPLWEGCFSSLCKDFQFRLWLVNISSVFFNQCVWALSPNSSYFDLTSIFKTPSLLSPFSADLHFDLTLIFKISSYLFIFFMSSLFRVHSHPHLFSSSAVFLILSMYHCHFPQLLPI